MYTHRVWQAVAGPLAGRATAPAARKTSGLGVNCRAALILAEIVFGIFGAASS